MTRHPVCTAESVAARAIDALLAVRVESGAQVGWPAWALTDPAVPARMAVDDVTLYNGDAGIAWALGGLGQAMGRPELADLGRRAAARALDAARTLPGEGLLAGRAGVRLAAYANGIAAGAGPVRPDASDLTDGAAGVLLAHVRTGTTPDGELVRLLARRAVAQEVGWAWADDPGGSGPGEQGGPATVEAPRAMPLLGLAHGASGVALALAEAAAIAPDLRPGLALAVGGLAWESGWFDPIQGWPDLRSDEPTFPVWWCHGAAGITTVRLRLLQLAQDGVDLGMPLASLRAQAHAGVQLCLEHVEAAVASLDTDEVPSGGLTLCHGLGGALDALALASAVSGEAEHREVAAAALGRVAAAMGDDPMGWPCGTREPGSSSLFLGLAGVAMVAARLAWPDAGVPSPSLLLG